MYVAPRSTIANDRHALQLTIAVAAVAVALLGSTKAAAVVDLNNKNTNSVGDESCTCVPFYLCQSGDEVPLSVTNSCPSGLNVLMTCCRNETRDTTNGTLMASEPPPNQNIVQDHGVDQQQPVTAENCGNDPGCTNKKYTVGGTNESNENNNVNARTCGVGITSEANKVSSRIANVDDEASKTYFGQFPWMVAVMKTYLDPLTGSKTNDFSYLCGGSLIHPKVVLTAAHCVKKLRLDELKVRVGEWDTLSNTNTEHRHQDISASEVVIHPSFNNRSMHNDVALIKLSTETVIDQYINTICIPNPALQSDYDPKSCVVTGWGRNALGKYQNILKAIYLPMVPHDECQQKLKRTRLGNQFILDKSFVCAGGASQQDTCEGDGGGPLICAAAENGDTSSGLKKYIQVGVVSWGIGCGEENVPGVYSSVEANSKWINQTIGMLTQ